MCVFTLGSTHDDFNVLLRATLPAEPSKVFDAVSRPEDLFPPLLDKAMPTRCSSCEPEPGPKFGGQRNAVREAKSRVQAFGCQD